jgi:hypothetical protein
MSVREAINRAWDDSPIFRLVIGLFVVGFLLWAFVDQHRQAAVGLLLLVVWTLQATWKFFLVVLAALLCGFAYWRIRSRQMYVIKLLLEIKDRLR